MDDRTQEIEELLRDCVTFFAGNGGDARELESRCASAVREVGRLAAAEARHEDQMRGARKAIRLGVRQREQAEAQVQQLQEALRPFGSWLDGLPADDWRNTYSDEYPITEARQKLGDYRRARAALAASPTSEK